MSHCAMRALSEVLAWAFLLGLAGDILEVSSATESEFSSIQAVMCSNVSVVSDDVYASSSDDIEDMICLAYYPSPFSFSQFPFSTTCTEIGGTLHNPATGDYGEQPCCFPNASACDGTSLKVNTVSSADCRSGGAFEISGPTPSTMRTCSVYAGCPQGQYARQVPTATTSLLCSVVVYCGGGSLYEQIPATATTNAQCAQLEQCTLGTSYQIVQPTFSSDRVCAPCNDSCGAGEYIVRTCNLTANIACVGAASQQPPTERHALSTGDVAAIIACVLLAFIVATYVAMQWGRTLGAKTKKYIEGREMLLMEAEGREAEARADIDRMLAAWQIPERDVVFHRVFAEGTYGEVWEGTWSNIKVAIKLIKQPIDADIDPFAAEDYRRECKTLQSIRHPSLLLFFGAGTKVQTRQSFIITEFMPKGSLRRVLADSRASSEELPWEQRLEWARHIADAMQHLHRVPIIHRDLKSVRTHAPLPRKTPYWMMERGGERWGASLVSAERIMMDLAFLTKRGENNLTLICVSTKQHQKRSHALWCWGHNGGRACRGNGVWGHNACRTGQCAGRRQPQGQGG
eukprot:m.1444556 g.1444556  ORF g.1444556 m.1444556 type:complete len:571 (-) comp25106_c0_seq1:831-2543(-)